MTNSERVMIFIDGSNLYFSLKNIKARRPELPSLMQFSLKKLGEKLCDNDRKLIRTYYYNAALDLSKDKDAYQSQQKWFAKVQATPDTELVLAKRHRRVDKEGRVYYSIKGDDIHLAIDMLKYAFNNAYDTAILVTGDGDFYPAIRAVKAYGKRVEHAYFKSGHSSLLSQECDRNTLLDPLIEDLFDYTK